MIKSENWQKHLFLPMYICRKHRSPQIRKMGPFSNLPNTNENLVLLFKRNARRAHVKKNTNSYLIIFLVNIWNQGKKIQDKHGQWQKHGKNVRLDSVKYGHFILILIDQITIFSLIFQRLSLRNNISLKKPNSVFDGLLKMIQA